MKGDPRFYYATAEHLSPRVWLLLRHSGILGIAVLYLMVRFLLEGVESKLFNNASLLNKRNR